MNSPDTDHDLLRRCQRKETAALAELIDRRQQALFQLALRVIGGDAALAEEIVVDAFYKIWSNARDWRDGSPSAWMSRIVVRTALDARRSQQRRRQHETAAAIAPLQQKRRQAALDPRQQAEAREEQAQRASAIEQSLAQLAPADRALVHLYYYEERPLAEIALILQITADAAKMRLSRIRQKLRRQEDPAGE